MKKTMWIAMSLILIAVLAAGCSSTGFKPQAVNEATDKCATCNMQVKDDAFAVQLTTKEGKTYKFDDLGCMNEWKTKNAGDAVAAQFVRDYNSKEWIKYEEAAYVFDPSFKSPMAYGIYSFKSKAEAQKFIDGQKKGKLMSAAELGAHTWERNKGAMNMGGKHDQNAHSVTEGGDKGMHGK